MREGMSVEVRFSFYAPFIICPFRLGVEKANQIYRLPALRLLVE
jgi:hypothetical protein